MSNVSVDASESSQAQGQPQNNNRRRFLTIGTAVVGAVGVIGAGIPFVASWNPSAKAKAAGADVEVDISGIEPGQLVRVMWRSKPVWIVRRTPEILAALAAHEGELRDPNSEVEQQPTFAQNQWRSLKEEYLVLVGICTHLGCSPTFRPDIGAADLGGDSWLGGFFCPCHSSKFDLAGRVFQGVPAPTNLVVPPHKYLSDNVILVGEDEGAA